MAQHRLLEHSSTLGGHRETSPEATPLDPRTTFHVRRPRHSAVAPRLGTSLLHSSSSSRAAALRREARRETIVPTPTSTTVSSNAQYPTWRGDGNTDADRSIPNHQSDQTATAATIAGRAHVRGRFRRSRIAMEAMIATPANSWTNPPTCDAKP